jgi:putative sigma-54 modulation protein
VKIDYTGRNLHFDDRLRSFVETKLQKLTKFLDEPIEVRVILEAEKHRHIAELHVIHRLGDLHTKEETDGSNQDALQFAIDKLERQAERVAKKRVDKRRRNHTNGHHRWPVEVLDRDSVGGGATPRVVESTHLKIKPMTIEEAALELDQASEGFVVFRDAGSDRLAVLYRRSDSNYGLIAPDER